MSSNSLFYCCTKNNLNQNIYRNNQHAIRYETKPPFSDIFIQIGENEGKEIIEAFDPKNWWKHGRHDLFVPRPDWTREHGWI